MNCFQELPDSANILGAVAVNLADRYSVYAFELDLTTPEEVADVVRRMHECGWPVKFDPITGTFVLDDERFDKEHPRFDFVDRNNVRCDCVSLRAHLRHLVDQDRSYRRLVIQDSLMPILRRITSNPARGSEFIKSAIAHYTRPIETGICEPEVEE